MSISGAEVIDTLSTLKEYKGWKCTHAEEFGFVLELGGVEPWYRKSKQTQI